MKLTITKPTEVNAKFLQVYCGDRLTHKTFKIEDKFYEGTQELFKDFPTLHSKSIDRSDDLVLVIDIDTGEVINWPKGIPGNMYNWKIVDEGLYELLDGDSNNIHTYEGYVPSCLDISDDGYGDYFNFEIDKNGYIKNWKFSQNDLNEMCGIEYE